MSDKKRSAGLRAFNALCALTALSAGVYIFFAGAEILAMAALCCAIAGVATPIVTSGGGIGEMIAGVAEALTDGISAIFEAIASMVSGLFG